MSARLWLSRSIVLRRVFSGRPFRVWWSVIFISLLFWCFAFAVLPQSAEGKDNGYENNHQAQRNLVHKRFGWFKTQSRRNLYPKSQRNGCGQLRSRREADARRGNNRADGSPRYVDVASQARRHGR